MSPALKLSSILMSKKDLGLTPDEVLEEGVKGERDLFIYVKTTPLRVMYPKEGYGGVFGTVKIEEKSNHEISGLYQLTVDDIFQFIQSTDKKFSPVLIYNQFVTGLKSIPFSDEGAPFLDISCTDDVYTINDILFYQESNKTCDVSLPRNTAKELNVASKISKDKNDETRKKLIREIAVKLDNENPEYSPDELATETYKKYSKAIKEIKGDYNRPLSSRAENFTINVLIDTFPDKKFNLKKKPSKKKTASLS